MNRDPDNDLHLQIVDEATFKQNQMIVEIPPKEKFCDVRTQMMDLFRADGGTSSSKPYVFDTARDVEITNCLYLDSYHGSTCSASGGRELRMV
jgi:hypothetical protein